jgi:hypothetical protein
MDLSQAQIGLEEMTQALAHRGWLCNGSVEGGTVPSSSTEGP